LRSDQTALIERTVRDFAVRIVELRKAKGWSQEKLAEEADLHRTYIGGIERALRNVSLHNIAKLARALGVPIAELFPVRSRR
jgi:transcriptional regulator with XRE-family HTH domain